MNKNYKRYPVNGLLVDTNNKSSIKKIIISYSLMITVLTIFTAYINCKTVEAAELGSTLVRGSINNEVSLSTPKYDIVEVVKNVSQSVVSINIKSLIKNSSNEKETLSSSGSGIIINEDDEKIYIVTNYHVIQDAYDITVSIDDDKVVSAQYIGSNPQSDLAVISALKGDLINAEIDCYSIAKPGDSDKIEVGEYVIAIGNALGEGNTVTDGIISAKNKLISVGDTKLSVMQTNAAINQGNSGGPLSNMNGEIIGINTAKLSKTGVEGIGYSIPINDAKVVIEDIIQNQKNSAENPNIKTPQLGIKCITITSKMADKYNFPSQGVYIVETIEGGSAENAEFKRGDIIIGFESAKITTIEELETEIKKCNSGDAVKIYIYRKDSSVPTRIIVII